MKQVYHLLMFVLITFTSFSQAKQTSSHKPGQTFHDCPDCPEMVVIPVGSFTMGSTVSELASRNWGPAEGGTIHDYGSSGLGFRVAKTL